MYPFFFGLLSLALSFGISSQIGVQGLGLLAVGFIGFFPSAAIVSITIGRLFPPELIPVDESLCR
jgi:hypothetical protein